MLGLGPVVPMLGTGYTEGEQAVGDVNQSRTDFCSRSPGARHGSTRTISGPARTVRNVSASKGLTVDAYWTVASKVGARLGPTAITVTAVSEPHRSTEKPPGRTKARELTTVEVRI